MILTQEQYQIALNKMPLSQIETLRILYYMPDSSATAKGLAIALGYKSFQGTNGQIGRIGKKIHEITGLKPKIYIDRGEEHLAYFEFVGPYTTKGWKMHKNLCLALEALNLVFPDKDEDKLIDRLPTEISLSEEDILLKEGKTTKLKFGLLDLLSGLSV